ncbi:MAG: hypothetical protein GY757_07705, partial [bacterium]|nr:hypothetical protein [bacterium]
VYESEIREFDVATITEEYTRELEKLKKMYTSLLGKYNQQTQCQSALTPKRCAYQALL